MVTRDTGSEELLGGRYRLHEQIGRGGMATVWRATDERLGRVVAVKRLHAGMIDDPGVAERFQREADVVARLSHPHLVRLLDRGEERAGPFLVLELVDGETLKELLRRRGRLEPAEAMATCAAIAHAAHAAHSRGVVHRDIKAQNVLVDRDGVAKLADFGIARILESAAGHGLTRTGTLMGSGDYLAPEQAHGGPVDGRSDVYSLGIVLYECLTGRLPFAGDSWVAVAMKHVSEPLPDPRLIAPDVPDEVVACLRRATAKLPAERFATAEEFAACLEGRVVSREATAVMPAAIPAAERTRRPRPRWGRIAAVAGVVVALGVLGIAALGGSFDPLGGSDEAGSAEPLVPSQIADHDPEGEDRSEAPELVALASDGDPASAWYTETYRGSAELGGLKSGVGLLVRFPQAVVARAVELTSPTAGADFQVQVTPALGGAPVVVGSGRTAAGAVTVPLADHEPSQEYILWFIRLAADGDGYRAGVGEVRFTGVANP